MVPKYRAWHHGDKKMLKVEQILFDGPGYVETSASDELYDAFLEVDLMRSTSLKDLKDIEVYDGDIVHVGDKTHGFRAVVKDFGWSFYFEDMTGTDELGYIRDRYWDEKGLLDLEVLGNIYENPELLEVKS